MAEQTPAETLQEPRSFARLTPSNLAARLEFHHIAEAVQNSIFEHHAQYMHIDPERAPLVDVQAAHSHAADTDYDTAAETDSATEFDTDTETFVAINPVRKIWVGHYHLDLSIKPSFPSVGWRIGRGRWKLGHAGHDPVGGVDILLTTKTSQSVRGLHARFSFDKISGLLLLKAHHAEPYTVAINGDSFGQSFRALNQRNSRLKFGSLEYTFAYTLEPGSQGEAKFQNDKIKYFAEHLQSASPPPSISATPSATDVILCGWVLRGALGSGAYGTVSAASDDLGRVVAVKTLVRRNERTSSNVQKEIDVVQQLKPILEADDLKGRIIRFIRVIYQRGRPLFDGGLVENVWILYTPLARLTFTDLAREPKLKREPTKTKAILFKQVLEGLEFLHSHAWIHRDIKPANLGIVSLRPPRAVILDLGCACTIPKHGYIKPKLGRYGTLSYIAPELETDLYTQSIDIWSLGVVGCELFDGYHPWLARQNTTVHINPWLRTDRVFYHLSKQKYLETIARFKMSEQSSIENLLVQMIRCTPYKMNETADNDERISALEALDHVFLRDTPLDPD